jgi:hypothetical protein
MKGGKLVHRTVSPEQAEFLRLAIANYRNAKKIRKDCRRSHGYCGEARGAFASPNSPPSNICEPSGHRDQQCRFV